jgi:alpha-galactosidase
LNAAAPTSPLGLRVAHDPDGPSWTLFWHGLRLDIHLHPTALVCDHFAPAGGAPPGPLWSSWREHEMLLNARLPGMVEVGPRPGCLAWRLDGWSRPDPWSLEITLDAEGAALVCAQRFSVDPATGLLLRGTVLRHAGEGGPVSITAASSLWLTLRGGARAVHTLTGEWGGEAQAAVHPGGHAGLLLDSRSGKTGFEFQPWIALEGAEGVHLCNLLWSGNWALQARLRAGTSTISGGLNDWGLAHALHPGEVLRLPEALIGFVPGTLDDAVRLLHDWRRARRPDPDRAVPVQFNTWYALDEDVDAARVLGLVPQAADLGCEVFVLDAGWYASHAWSPLSNWHARAGDWVVDAARFPRGLAPVAEACRAAGMGFGLWCEPEAVGSCAAIRRSHPEWLHHLDGRAPGADARAILNLGVPAAWDHAFAVLAGLIRQTGAAWLKWDFNADLAAGGWAPGLPAALVAGDPLVAHVRGLYRLQDAIRAAFPDLVLEMCASGGGRMDGAVLMRAHTNWISDNPQAVAKLSIHMGMQRAHPAVSCNDWLVDWPARSYSGIGGVDRRGDLAFRVRVAMLGSFGISAPIGGWSEADRAVVRAHVRLYRERVRALVHHGDQYQLTSPPTLEGGGGWAAVWYRARDGSRGVLFAFRLEGEAVREFVLPGLAEGAVAEGAARIAGGVRVVLAAPFSSALVFLD